jgi:hypothetical protein
MSEWYRYHIGQEVSFRDPETGHLFSGIIVTRMHVKGAVPRYTINVELSDWGMFDTYNISEPDIISHYNSGRCECGAATAGTTHGHWCPLAHQNWKNR